MVGGGCFLWAQVDIWECGRGDGKDSIQRKGWRQARASSSLQEGIDIPRYTDNHDFMTSRLPHKAKAEAKPEQGQGNKAWKEAGNILDDEHPICPSIHPSIHPNREVMPPSMEGDPSFYPTSLLQRDQQQSISGAGDDGRRSSSIIIIAAAQCIQRAICPRGLVVGKIPMAPSFQHYQHQITLSTLQARQTTTR